MITVRHKKHQLAKSRGAFPLHQRLQRLHCRHPVFAVVFKLPNVIPRGIRHLVLGVGARKTAEQLNRLGKMRLLFILMKALKIAQPLVESRVRPLGVRFVFAGKGVKTFGRTLIVLEIVQPNQPQPKQGLRGIHSLEDRSHLVCSSSFLEPTQSLMSLTHKHACSLFDLRALNQPFKCIHFLNRGLPVFPQICRLQQTLEYVCRQLPFLLA